MLGAYWDRCWAELIEAALERPRLHLDGQTRAALRGPGERSLCGSLANTHIDPRNQVTAFINRKDPQTLSWKFEFYQLDSL